MTPEQRQRVADEFQRLASLAVDHRHRELVGLRSREPAVAAEVERLLSAESGHEGVSEQLRHEISPGSSGPTMKHEPETRRKPPAEQVGPYRIVREIGHGGLGYVLLGVREDDRFHKRVAVKLVKKGMDTEEILRRFEQERQVLSALNHPNIARVFDAGTTGDGRPYFVMEYVDGVPIDTYCDSQGLNTEQRLRLFSKVCAAVHYAHQNLIVHRDIKPSNIIVTADGEPKLLDFGIAKLLNPDLLFSPVTTGPELRLMTPEYASPEQVEGLPITTSSDVYSLGVLLYTLLTGHPPYRLRSRVRDEIVRVVCQLDPERPSTSITKAVEIESPDGTTRTLSPEEIARNRDGQVSKLRRRLAGDIDNIVLMAMRKKPPRRYRSAEQFAEDIGRHLSGKPVIARPETWWYVAGKFAHRNRLGIAAAATVALALVLGFGAAMWQWRRAESRYELVLGLARSHIDQQKQIADRIGSSAAQRVLVEASLPALDAMAKAGGADSALNGLLARGYSALGDIEREWPDPGSLDRAIAAFERAVEQRRAGLAGEGVEGRVELGLALVDLASVHFDAGSPEASDKALQEATSIAGELKKTHAEDPRVKQLFSLIRFEQGRQLVRAGAEKRAEARQALEESVSILGSLRAARAEDPSTRVSLAKALIELGRLEYDAKRGVEAEAAFKQVRDSLSTLVSSSPESAGVQRLMVSASAWLGHIVLNASLDGRSRIDEAVGYLEQARNTATRLVQDDPLSEANAQLLRRTLEVHGDSIFLRGKALAEAGKAEEARTLFARSVEYLRPFVEQSERARQANPSPQREWAVAVGHEKMADSQRMLGEFEMARDSYQRAIDHYRKAINAQSPGRLKVRIGICLASQAAAFEELDRTSEAIDAYTQAVANLEEGLAEAEHRDWTRFLLSIAARNAGGLKLNKGRDPAGAIPLLLKAAEHLDSGYESEPHAVHMLLGRAYMETSPPDRQKAVLSLEKAGEEYAGLKAPTDRDHGHGAEAFLWMGRAKRDGGEVETACATWTRGVEALALIKAPDEEARKAMAELQAELAKHAVR